jgi:DNA polymerase III delta prime subunit
VKLSQKSSSNIHHILLFGPPKSGKTQLAGTLAGPFNLHWFDLENGYETLLKLPTDAKDAVEIFSIPDTRSFPVAIETMLKVIKGGRFEICETHGKVSCALCKKEGLATVSINTVEWTSKDVLVVDSLTQLTNSAIAHITKNQPDDYKLNYDDWGNLGKLMDAFLSHVQNAPFNVVCISHETETEMEDGKLKLVPTAGTRNFSRNTARYFGEVIYCEVKNRKHIAASSTTYANNILTGSRTGVVLEGSELSSLLPIFAGSGTNSGTKSGDVGGATNAETAVSSLAAMKARMAAKS